jgi:hypothetical protein
MPRNISESSDDVWGTAHQLHACYHVQIPFSLIHFKAHNNKAFNTPQNYYM